MATYGSEAGVEALVPSAGNLNNSSTPKIAQVTAWLSQGYAVINRHLAGAGYDTPVTSGAAAYDELTALNNLYAAANVLRALGLDVITGEDGNRAETWIADFRTQLHELVQADLTALGVSLTATTGTATRRRVRSMQVRRTDGYSGAHEGSTRAYPYPSD